MKNKQKFIVLSAIMILLTACGGGGDSPDQSKPAINKPDNPTGGGSDRTIVRPTNLKQFKATGWDRITHTGSGQKIGIMESGNFGNLDEYKDRLKAGLQFTNTGTASSYNPALDKSVGNHSAMVTGLAVGKNYGIAKGSDIIPYKIFLNFGNPARTKHNMKAIYDHAKTNNLVALNASWGDSFGDSNAIFDGIKADASLRENGETGEDVVNKIKHMFGKFIIYRTDDSKAVKIIFGSKQCTATKYLLKQRQDGKKVYVSNADQELVNELNLKLLQALNSLACEGGYSKYITRSYYEEMFGKNFFDKLEAESDKDTDDNNPIWVFAAGNDSETNTDVLASIPGKYKKLEKYWLAAVNINTDYKLNKDSAPCGKARAYCLGAIGQNASSVDEKGKKDPAGGTSAAAPQITAGLAVIKSAFTTKTNSWVRRRMLATARHTTADGYKLRDKDNNIVTPDSNGFSDVFGRGIMRLDLATKPLGELSTLSSGDTLHQAQITPLSKTAITSPSAFGDGVKSGFSGIKTKVFDAMGASFDYDLSNSVVLQNTTTKVFYNNTNTQRNLFTNNTKSTTVNYTNKNIHPYSQQGDINFSYNISNDLSLSYVTNQKSKNTLQINKKLDKLNLSSGIVYEKGSFLGTKQSGAFKTNSLAITQYIKADYNTNINGFGISGNIVYGLTQSNEPDAMLSINKAYSVSSNIEISKNNWNFGIKMPLRVLKTKSKVKYISHISKGKNNNDKLHYTTKTVNLKPSGKHTIFNAIYKKQNWATGLAYHKDKDHIKNNNETIMFASYSMKF